MTDTAHAERSLSDDEGMGLIEIVIAMFILAIVAVAFLPLLLQGIQESAKNSTLATATQLVHQEMELARGITCGPSAVTANTVTVDPRAVSLKITRTVDLCPTVRPGTFKVSAVAIREDTGAILARASTLVYLGRD